MFTVLKRYLDEQKGSDHWKSVWTDIMPVGIDGKERTGYPTQKPIALLERIIRASSNEGDIVFDPFCGCATTLVAADRMERQWAGIDLSPLAVKLVNERINEDRGALWGGANVVDSLPQRTDLGDIPNYRTHRHRLYGEQEGICVGCDTHFPFKVMEVDHILPQSRGGTDHFDNLQLLCSHCNRSKGSKTMSECGRCRGEPLARPQSHTWLARNRTRIVVSHWLARNRTRWRPIGSPAIVHVLWRPIVSPEKPKTHIYHAKLAPITPQSPLLTSARLRLSRFGRLFRYHLHCGKAAAFRYGLGRERPTQ